MVVAMQKKERQKQVYAFVGLPDVSVVYSRIVDNADDGDTLERELDDMMDFIDGGRTQHPIWATYPVDQISFSTACKNFGEYMAYRRGVE